MRNSIRRSARQAGVALDHAALHFDRAAHGVDHAPELDDRAVAGALDDAAMMNRDDGVDEIAAQGSQAREDADPRSPWLPASRLYPTTSETRIAASFQVSPIAPPPVAGRLAQTIRPFLGYSWGRKRSSR